MPVAHALVVPTEARVGRPVAISVSVVNTTEAALTLAEPVDLIIQVAKEEPGGKAGAMIWQGALPPLTGELGSHTAAALAFKWDQRDAGGAQVPAGTYIVEFNRPLTVSWAQNGRADHETIEGSGAAAVSGFAYVRSITLTS